MPPEDGRNAIPAIVHHADSGYTEVLCSREREREVVRLVTQGRKTIQRRGGTPFDGKVAPAKRGFRDPRQGVTHLVIAPGGPGSVRGSMSSISDVDPKRGYAVKNRQAIIVIDLANERYYIEAEAMAPAHVMVSAEARAADLGFEVLDDSEALPEFLSNGRMRYWMALAHPEPEAA